jgi:hypothetical protein
MRYEPILDGPEPPAPEQTREEYLEQQADIDHASGVRSRLLEGIDTLLRVMRPPTRLHSIQGNINGSTDSLRHHCD